MLYVGSGLSMFGVVMAEKRAQASTMVISGPAQEEREIKSVNRFTEKGGGRG